MTHTFKDRHMICTLKYCMRQHTHTHHTHIRIVCLAFNHTDWTLWPSIRWITVDLAEYLLSIYRLLTIEVVYIQQIFPPSVLAVIYFNALVRPKWSISKVARQTDTDHHQQHVGWSQPETTRGASTWGLNVDHRSNM